MLRVQSCKVLLSALQDLAKPLLERFMGEEPPQFDSQVSHILFTVAVYIILQYYVFDFIGRSSLQELVIPLEKEHKIKQLSQCLRHLHKYHTTILRSYFALN